MTLPFAPDTFAKDKAEALAAQRGLELTHPQQWDFLQSAESLDLQAAPGSGKTSFFRERLAATFRLGKSIGEEVEQWPRSHSLDRAGEAGQDQRVSARDRRPDVHAQLAHLRLDVLDGQHPRPDCTSVSITSSRRA